MELLNLLEFYKNGNDLHSMMMTYDVFFKIEILIMMLLTFKF